MFFAVYSVLVVRILLWGQCVFVCALAVHFMIVGVLLWIRVFFGCCVFNMCVVCFSMDSKWFGVIVAVHSMFVV